MKLRELSNEQILNLAQQYFGEEHVKSNEDIEVTWDNDFEEPILCINCDSHLTMLCITAQGGLWAQSTGVWETYGIVGKAFNWLIDNKVEPFYREDNDAPDFNIDAE